MPHGTPDPEDENTKIALEYAAPQEIFMLSQFFTDMQAKQLAARAPFYIAFAAMARRLSYDRNLWDSVSLDLKRAQSEFRNLDSLTTSLFGKKLSRDQKVYFISDVAEAIDYFRSPPRQNNLLTLIAEALSKLEQALKNDQITNFDLGDALGITMASYIVERNDELEVGLLKEEWKSQGNLVQVEGNISIVTRNLLQQAGLDAPFNLALKRDLKLNRYASLDKEGRFVVSRTSRSMNTAKRS